MYCPFRSPLQPPSPPHPFGSSQCTSPEYLSHASNLGWWSVSPLIVYMFQCCSLKVISLQLIKINGKKKTELSRPIWASNPWYSQWSKWIHIWLTTRKLDKIFEIDVFRQWTISITKMGSLTEGKQMNNSYDHSGF